MGDVCIKFNDIPVISNIYIKFATLKEFRLTMMELI